MLLKNNITIREKKQRSFLSLLLRLFERNEMLTNSVISRVYAIYKKEKWRSLLSILFRAKEKTKENPEEIHKKPNDTKRFSN